MELTVPALSLVALVGPSGSGKSTFAARHFLATEVLSSDALRGVVSDDETDQSATPDAFDVLHYVAGKRLARGKLVVVDATSTQSAARKSLVELARKQHAMTVAIVFNLPEEECLRRNEGRADRQFGPHVVRRQVQELRRSLRNLEREGFRYVYVLKSQEEVDAATIVRQRMWTDRRDEHGPFDLIGDVHGCFDELVALLQQLGYAVTEGEGGWQAAHPEGRKAVFLGDLVDRGPRTPDVLRLAMNMTAAGNAICVPGNHENKLVRKLRGRDVQLTHGIAETLAQLDNEPAEFRQQVLSFLDGLVSHFVLDDGKLVACHAGLPAEMHGRASNAVRDFALYGETTGETDEYGLPVRYNWAREYRGAATVVYGHTPVPEAEWENNTICLDTGCVFGGRLTALRYPERELVAVPAAQVYYEPVRPFPANDGATLADPPRGDDVLRIEDVTGRRLVRTELQGVVAISEEHAAAALEVMSRWAVDPRWLIYLPPTMSPPETSQRPALLEHPDEAFAYYRQNGVAQVVCQEKHMGSRALVVVCRDAEAASRRFKVSDGAIGMVYTRTGRRFFDRIDWETMLLERVRDAATGAGLWEELGTDWLLLDCELMPWSAKAEPLIRQQYASVGAAAGAMLGAAAGQLQRALPKGDAVAEILARTAQRQESIAGYRAAYGHYAWRVESLADLRLAPFHLLASEGAVHIDRDHAWHLALLDRLCDSDSTTVLHKTPSLAVDTTDDASTAAASEWWAAGTARGVEGMVVKPSAFVARGNRGLLQPAMKVRGSEYLRIIYGPEYTLPANLERLRARAVAAKRRLALREFALGIEALSRFVRNEPLYRVHECVFGVLALESEPVDPRL